MHYIKKTLLAAAMAAFSLTVAFPAFADEPVGTDVTVVDAGTSDTPEDTAQDVQESQETSGSRESKGHRAAVVNESLKKILIPLPIIKMFLWQEIHK